MRKKIIIMAVLLLLPLVALQAQEIAQTQKNSVRFGVSVYGGPHLDLTQNDTTRWLCGMAGLQMTMEMWNFVQVDLGLGYRNYHGYYNYYDYCPWGVADVVGKMDYIDYYLSLSWRLHQWDRFSLWYMLPGIGVTTLVHESPVYSETRLHKHTCFATIGLTGKWQYSSRLSFFCSLQYTAFLSENVYNVTKTVEEKTTIFEDMERSDMLESLFKLDYFHNSLYDQASEVRMLFGATWYFSSPKEKKVADMGATAVLLQDK